ncbi:M16 family metallopeptidase [Sphingomonas colocasiae]|uniref:Insulinase family protein n=1 Tax=Sphingomonas colocasiae TaxID=1848973 RepID=A0ABS7PQM7_9SPHN|nr:pitrilysin family protein [Sphingomonas colocasiae]MBY8823279.1 insulinase family protein [Sphingomonas colocasiae]
MSMPRRAPVRALVSLALATSAIQPLAAAPKPAAAQPAARAAVDPLLARIDIPQTTFRLPNGLTVIVHEDHKAPVVAVSVWYGIGSAHEPAGKTGFAHLFEHLMFNGSKNFNKDWFGPLQEVGATNLNGTTSFDRTNYYQTVPKTALDRVLWMESDRMIYLLDAIDQARLDEQRAVVKNEKRQGENKPFGKVGDVQFATIFPEGHGYHHTPIGSMEDLDAASLDDVKNWFTTNYGATNTVLVLSGDITVAEAKEKVARYFGSARPGEPLPKPQQDVPVRASNAEVRMKDNIAQVNLMRDWATPGREGADAPALDMAAFVLGNGRNSRLYKALVEGKALATSASASLSELELAGTFGIHVVLKPGASEAEAAAEVDRVVAEFLKTGPTEAELQRARTKINASYVRMLETVDGKASILAEAHLYGGDANRWKTRLVRQNQVTAPQVLAAARAWLGHGYTQMVVEPFGRYASAPDTVDRSTGVPAVTSTPDLVWPTIERTTLSNGMPVVFVKRDSVPVVNVALNFAGGTAGAVAMGKGGAGIAEFALGGLDDGAAGRTSGEIAGMFEDLGATFGATAGVDSATISFSALSSKLPETVALAASLIRQPDFPQVELERAKTNALAGIEQSKASAGGKAGRILAPTMFGPTHPYGMVPDEAAVKAVKRADLQAYMAEWIRPEGATIFVVGATSLAEIKPLLETAFGNWKGTGSARTISYPAVPAVTGTRVILVDQPGAPQSEIRAVLPGPKGLASDEEALSAMNVPLGGAFTSRINMNLREAKGWSYGARSSLSSERDQRIFTVSAPVQTDKTAEAITEIRKELEAYLKDRPVTAAEVADATKQVVRALPGQYETGGAVLGSMVGYHVRGRPLDYPASAKARWEALDVARVEAAARQVIDPTRITWIVVGDLSKIEAPIRALGLGPVTVRTVD